MKPNNLILSLDTGELFVTQSQILALQKALEDSYKNNPEAIKATDKIYRHISLFHEHFTIESIGGG